MISIYSETAWISDFNEGLEKSKISTKPIFLNLYTDWCTYCKVLDKTVLPDEDVLGELEKFTTVKLNGDENTPIIQKYNIKAYPSILILDKNGYLLEKIIGLTDVKSLISKMKSAYTRKDFEQELIDNQVKNSKKVEPNFKLGNFYYKNGNYKKAIDYFTLANQSDSETPIEERSESLFLLGISLIQERKFSEATSVWKLFREKYPNLKEEFIFYCIGITYYFDGNTIKSKEFLTKAKDYTKDKAQLEKIEEILKTL